MRQKTATIILALLCLLFVPSAVQAQNGRVTVVFDNTPLAQALKQLERASDYKFVFSYEDVSPYRVSRHFRDTPVREAVSAVLSGTPLTYSVDGRLLSIRKKEKSTNQRVKKHISGIVTEAETGDPVIGAQVAVVGTRTLTVTDVNGRFSLDMPSEGSYEARFSYVGMETMTAPLRDGMAIKLHAATKELQGVVVTGMFNKSKESFTGAVTTISGKELHEYGNKNLLTSIANIDPSFNILTNNTYGSDPNHLPDVQIRGAANMPTITDMQDNTRTDLNTPLVILDGFEITLTRMMDLNEDEVESITLLKDASATAIYGSRGANGVIVIKRRAPQGGKLRVSYTGSLNIEAPDLSDYHLLNAADKLELERRAGYYDSTDPARDFKLKQKYSAILQNVVRGVDTDWMAKPLRTGVGQRHTFRLEGGDTSFRYAVNLQYNGVAGVMKKSARNSFNGGITLSYQHRDFLFTNDLSIGHTKSNDSPYGSFSDYTRLNPYWKPYDDEGNIVKLFDNDVDFYGGFSNLPANPLYNATLHQKNSTAYTNITNNFAIEWRPVDGLITRACVSYTWQDNESDDYKPASHTMFEADEYQTDEGALRKGRYVYGTGKVNNYEVALTASYSKIFAEKHLLYTAVNWNLRQDYSRSYSFTLEGFPDETLDFPSNALQYQKGGKPSGAESKTRSVGLVTNVNYSYDNRYYTDLSWRMDGSSQFGKDRRFAPFWSAGLGWNVNNEPFMKNVKWLNKLKLRGSYGQTGSQNFNAWQAIATYTYYLSDRYNKWTGAYQKALENRDLEWQKTNKWDAGLEVSALDNRVSLVADVYLNRTSNLLSSLDLPLSNGFTSYVENIGKVENRGFELRSTVFVLRNEAKRFAWSLTGTMAHNRDKVVKLSQAMKDAYGKLLLTGSVMPNKVIREGESQYTIYAVPSLGIDPGTGYELFRKKDGTVTYTWDAADRVACGQSEPKYRGTLGSMVRWRGFSAVIALAYRFGGQLYNSTLAGRVENADKLYNVDRRVFEDRWQQPGDHTFFKGLTNETTTYATSRFVQDERTLTCQNVHLSYIFDQSPWLRRIGMRQLTVSGDFSDLFYISTVKQERGLSYPYSRRFSLSLSLAF